MPKVYKVMAVGDGAVGKTCLLHRLIKSDDSLEFENSEVVQNYSPTIFANHSHKIKCRGKTFDLDLWDSAGQEDLRWCRSVFWVLAQKFQTTRQNPKNFPPNLLQSRFS